MEVFDLVEQDKDGKKIKIAASKICPDKPLRTQVELAT